MPTRQDVQLLERAREVETLDALIDAAAAGDGRIALIEGQAGIGKSRLLAETRERAQSAGMRVLAAKGSELEREFPFGVVRQLFEPSLIDPDTRSAWLAGAAAAAGSIFEGFETPEDASRDASFAALHGLYWLVVNAAADKPVLLALDDLHWVDRPSLRFVAYLARRLEGLPALVATSLRSAEPGTDPALLGEIVNDPATVAVRPGALSADGVTQLVRERLAEDADEAFCAACHATTGGNPLLLRQLLSSLESEGVQPEARNAAVVRDIGPRAVSRTVLLRLARLPGEAAAVARAVAVLGENADVPAAAALAEIDERAAADATAALARVEILRPDPPLAFVHPLVRDAIYHDLPPGERELQHARAARMLADSGASPEQIASHLLTVPRRGDGWVSQQLVEAAHAALWKGAPESAVSYFRRAIDEPPPEDARAVLLFELGMAEISTFGPDAVTHLRAAYDLLGDVVARALAAYALARTLLFTGAPAEGATLAQRTARELPDKFLDLKQSLESLVYYGIVFGGMSQEGLADYEDYRRGVPGEGYGARMLEAVAVYDWAVSGGHADEVSALALRALGDGVLVREDNGLSNIPPIGVLALADREEALEHLDDAYADAHRRGALFALLGANAWRAFTLWLRGELVDGEAEARAGWEAMQLWGEMTGQVLAYNTSVLGAIQVERGELAAARETLNASGDLAPEAHSTFLWIRARAELELAEGNPEAALALCDEAASNVGRIVNPAWIPWRSLKARALDRLGRSDEALKLALEELPFSQAWGAPSTVARTLREIGTIEREAGIDRLREAVSVVEGSPAKLEHAKCLFALGSAVRRSRKPTDAREPLRQALELAFVCGAAGLAEEIRTELHATGVRPRTEALSGPAALTAKERKVAALAADGQTNRDIAQSLYVTPKTVEVHLTNAYRKLGIRSRRELAGALAA
jgi:DNA-binding CsgD family transcriptional regulator